MNMEVWKLYGKQHPITFITGISFQQIEKEKQNIPVLTAMDVRINVLCHSGSKVSTFTF